MFFLNILIISILLLICFLPYEGLVILCELLLLTMQTIFYWILTLLNTIIANFNIIEFLGIKKSVNLNTLNDINFEIDQINTFIKKVEKPMSDDFFDRYDFSELFQHFLEFFYIYRWFLLPIVLYFLLIYVLHGILGLYSAYVDYFQKNPDHFESPRAFVPAIFIFYLLIFIFFALIYFFCFLYLHYILWFLFI
jgi:succinate dehydrogenase hydrophobic anchor subunit